MGIAMATLFMVLVLMSAAWLVSLWNNNKMVLAVRKALNIDVDEIKEAVSEIDEMMESKPRKKKKSKKKAKA